MHGAGHMYLATKKDALSGVPRLRQPDLETKTIVMLVVFFFMFWFGFMKGILRSFSMPFVIAVSLLLEVVHMFFIPARYAFTYVQSALLISGSLAELYRHDKSEKSVY